MKSGEWMALFLGLVRDGVLKVDGDGRVWKIAKRCLQSGTCRVVPTPARRAERQQSSGYLQVFASFDGTTRCVLAHRLAYTVLVGPIPAGRQINHLNGCKQDNRPANLEAVTASANNRHAVRTGLAVALKGERHALCKTPDAVVVTLREAYASGGASQKDLAERFGLSRRYASELLRGKRRRSAGGYIEGRDRRGEDLRRDPSSGRLVSRAGSQYLLKGVSP